MTAASSRPSSSPTHAPKTRRGRYDRGASASERARAQRATLLDAVRRCALERPEHELTVTRLVESVGCGRNTFYEHFDEIGQAVEAACRESADHLGVVLQRALFTDVPLTPTDLMWELATAWATWCWLDTGMHWAILERHGPVWLDAQLRFAIHNVYTSLVKAGRASGPLDALRADATCGALCAMAKRVHGSGFESGSSVASDGLRLASFDVLNRLLR